MRRSKLRVNAYLLAIPLPVVPLGFFLQCLLSHHGGAAGLSSFSITSPPVFEAFSYLIATAGLNREASVFFGVRSSDLQFRPISFWLRAHVWLDPQFKTKENLPCLTLLSFCCMVSCWLTHRFRTFQGLWTSRRAHLIVWDKVRPRIS